jgi:hypothetical protein
MTNSQVAAAASILAAVPALFGPAPVLAAEDTRNAVFKKNGLKVVGTVAVLETESEVKNKLTEARRLSKQLNYSLMQQQGTMSAEDIQKSIKGLGAEINQMKAQINALAQEMNRLPRGRRGFVNNLVAEQHAELSFYKQQLQAEVNQETAWLNQLRSQKFDPKSKEKIDAEVRDRRETYHQALLDLRQHVDSATEKYASLAKDEDVKKALGAVSKARGTKLKLGPSRDFSNNVKVVEKLEKAESGAEPDEAVAKPARRSRNEKKHQRSSRSSTKAGGASADDSDGSS